MIKHVIFVSREEAENKMKRPDWAVVSITEPNGPNGPARLMPGWFAIHRTEFHDIEPNLTYDQPYELMNIEHANKIVDFVETVAPNVQGIMVHCRAGVSRSAAVAKWIADRYELPFDHDYGYYNMHVYKMLHHVQKVGAQK